MNMSYNVNMPIKVLFNQIKDGMDYITAGNNHKTSEQIVMTGQQLITETGMFTDEIKDWKRLSAADRTWIQFKVDFTWAHQELRENFLIGAPTGYTINATREAELTEAMANLATSTAVD
eukprot:CAMPEP_0171311732 /NCGR_PEP_ID=MMETSP0816-20121228/22010_1 /TAXON_ID=420281 /ORGANISM="Proboscia inermis, Strain CCAP1064/1" /LENGTH=118 /DNA_ID=CAMNT_0011796701 /DNA_START=14 /DNA_END=370 /DNA_ORIENTATION=+